MERSSERIGFSLVGKFGEQELITKTFGMILAPEKHEQAPHFRIGMDNDAVSKTQVRYDGAVEFRPIAVGVRVYGREHFDVENSSLREGVERICLRVAKTSLQVKCENRSCRDANSFHRGTGNLGGGGNCKHTDSTQG